MRFFEEVKKRMFKPKASNERGSVTMFVLIAMLFFLTVGVLLFINNMNNSAAQQRDVKKIKSEYSTADTADLDKLYEEQEEKMPNRLIVSVVDKYNQIYSASGSDSNIVWIGNANADRLPLTIKVSWPEGLPENARQIKVNGTMRSGTGNTERVVFDSSNLNVNAIGLLNALTAIRQDCDLTITAIANPDTAQEMKTEIKVKVDITNPTATISPNGGIRYISPTKRKLLDPVTITGNDNLSETNKVEYIINQSTTTPSENDENWKEYTNPIDEIPNAQDGEKYYIYSKVTDKAGNVIIAKSDEYEIIAARATFDVGTAVNAKMKTLAGNENATHETADEKITSIVYNTEIPADKMTDAYKVSSADSRLPIYMWPTTDPEDETKVVMNWYSDDDTPYLNANSAYMFSDLQAVTQIAQLNKIDTSKSTTMEKLFKDCRALTSIDLSNFDTAKVTDMRYMFHDCVTLTTLDVSSLETQNVENMAWMFAGDNSNNTGTNQLMKLTSITGLTNFNTAKVTDMQRMFYLCTNMASVDVSSFDTSKVTNMSNMFAGAYPTSEQIYVKFAEIKGIENFNTSNVETMNGMFGLNSQLTSLDLSKWNTSKVTNMKAMFWFMTKLENLNISNFDTSKVTDMSWMFWNADKLTELDLRSFDTSNVLNFDYMFRNCAQLTTIYATDSFLIKSNATSSNMFLVCKKLVGGSGTAYSAEHINADYARIDGLNGLPGYFTNHYFIEFNANTENAQGTMTNQGIPFCYATNLKENGFTKDGYIFRGWATSPNGPVVYENGASMNYDLDGIKAVVTDAQDKADDKNVTLKLYAVWSVKHYEVTYGSPAITKPAETLVEAMSLAQDNATIKVTLGFEDTSVTDANNAAQGVLINKNITLDTNGQTLTMANTITVAANKTATFVDTATTGTLKRTTGDLITNNGNVTVNGGILESKNIVINGGTVNVLDGTVNNIGVVSGNTYAARAIDGRNITVSGGKISCDLSHSIVSSVSTTITGGTITSKNGIAPLSGTLNISGSPTISGTNYSIYYQDHQHPTITITGGTIKATNYEAIHGQGDDASLTKTITITGGTITGGTAGIGITSPNSKVIIGNSTTVNNQSTPVIRSTNGYSVQMTGANSTLEYYDGKLIGKNNDKTYEGREVTFDVAEASTTVRTGYKPYTRQNGDYYETVLEKEVTVTADAGDGTISATDGWTLAQDGKTATKKVLQNTEYGTLPTKDEMTREGYTFRGWNGKNLFDEESILMAIDGATKENGYYVFKPGKAHELYAADEKYIPINAKESTQYTFTINGHVSEHTIAIGFLYTNGNKDYKYFSEYQDKTISYTTAANKTLKGIQLSYNSNSDIAYIKSIQLEEGTTSTAYEPYIIESSTIVTQDTDHKIYANWEANNYKLTKVIGDNLVTNGDFENYTQVANPGWDGNLNSVEGDPTKAYYANGWGTGYNSYVSSPSIGYHAHLKIVDGNAVIDLKTNEDYSDSISLNRWLGIRNPIDANKLEAGKTYTITLDVYRVSGSGGTTARLVYPTTENAENYMDHRFIPSENGKWETLSYTFTLSNDYVNTGSPRLNIYGHTDNIEKEIYVDNVRLEEVEATSTDKAYDTTYTSTELAEPTRAGYTFQGWYNDSSYTTNLTTSDKLDTTKATFNDVNTAGTNAFIYAKWTANTYKIKFNANGGTGEMADLDMTYDVAKNLTSNAFTKTGYSFVKWTTNADGTGDEYTNNQSVNNLTTENGATVNLYAQWEANKYTVSFNPNGGEGGQTANVTATYDSAMPEISTTAPTKKGHTFTGWYSTTNATNLATSIAKVTDNEMRINFANSTNANNGWTMTKDGDKGTHIQGKITITDSTIGNKPHLQFNDRAITEKSAIKTGNDWVIYVDFDITEQMVTATGSTPYDTLYRFIDIQGAKPTSVITVDFLTKGGKKYYDANGTSVWNADFTENTTLYAGWEINKYNLTIDPDGGTWNGKTTATTVTQNYDTTYNVANNATRPGYIFGGWRLVDGSGNAQAIEPDGNIKYFDENTAQVLKQYKFTGTNSDKPSVYNNNYNGAVTHNIIADSSSSTGYSLEIKTNGTANPSAGGFANITQCIAGTFYYHKIVAKVPTGYTLSIHSNVTGIGYRSYLLTDNKGTGDWKTYIYVQYTGYNEPFDTLGHVVINGPDNTNVTWYLQESTMYKIANNLTELQATNVNYTFTDSNQTLKAIWSKNGSRLTFNNQGGTFGNGTTGTEWTEKFVDLYYNTQYTETHKVPYYTSDSDFAIYKTGYTLDGWYTEPNGQGTKLFDANGQLIPSVASYSDVNRKWLYYDSSFTLYANWTANPYTVTADANGGTFVNTDGWTNGEESGTVKKTVTYDSTYGTLPTLADRTGYTFKGWSIDKIEKLPDGYERLEYIQSNGTQYIDSEYKPGPNTGIESTFEMTDLTNQQRLFGMSSDASVEGTISYDFYINGGNCFAFAYQNNKGNWRSTYVPSDKNKHTLYFNVNDRKIIIDSSSIYQGSLENSVTNTSSENMPILARKKLDKSNVIDHNAKAKLYTFKIYENGTMVRNFVPCKNASGEVGLYETMQGKFYGKASGDAFTYGSDVYLKDTSKVATASDHKIYAIWKANEYTVTADANGGTFANTDGWTTGDVSGTVKKTVTYDSTYGTLPTLAERPGYTFKGWNGKNLFNPEELIAGKNIVSDEDGNISASSKTSDPSTWSYDNSNLKTSLPAGTYTISLNFSTRSTSSYAVVRVFDDANNELLTKNLQNVDFVSEKFTLSSAKNIGIKLKLYSGVAKVQLEKSDSATTYEPYYITDDTKVVQDTAHTLTAIWQANPYTVTANANGGTIGTATGWNKASGNATATKTINYDSTYGTLPVVSKTGYTFKGWNGKNLFDEESILMAIDGATYEDGYYKFNCSKADKAYGRIGGDINSNVGNKNMNITFKANTQYTLSFKGYTDYAEQAGVYETFYIGFFYTDGTFSRVYICGANEVERTLTSTAGKTVSRIAISYGRGYENVYAHIKNIQLEEGEAATTYEPYIINDTTPVTTAKAHTLTAVWDAIPYTVTYNYAENGGTSATKTTDTKIYEQAVDLTPTATKNGYTFVGWNTDKNATTALDSYSMPAGNVTLYAIYKKTLTATFRYYNNQSITRSVTIYNKLTSGNIITPAASGIPSGYTFRHWSTSNAANAESTVAAGGITEISANTTYYASYQKEVTATFNYFDVESNGTASATVTANSYMNYTGTKLESNFTVPDAAKTNVITPAYTLGDANGDGAVDTLDLTALKRYREEIEIPTYAQFHAADVNEDGVLDDTDKEWMQQYLINNRKFTVHEVPAQTYTFRGVSTSDEANATATTPTTANTVFYSSYQTDVTVTFNYFDVEANGTVSTTATGTRYMNHAGRRIEASLTVPSAAMANVTTPAYTLGDVNGDGEVDTLDLTALKRYTNEIEVPTYAQFHAADVNEDGVLDDTDKEWMQQYLINIRKFTAHEVPEQTYTYRGVSISDDANAESTTPTTAHTAYYSSYSAEITATFNYLDANEGADAKASATATGTRYMNYAGRREETSLTVPSAAMANVTTPAYTLGDINNDGKVNTTDNTTLKRYIEEIDVPTYAQFHAADVNEDGVLDDTDKTWFKSYMIGTKRFTMKNVPIETYTYLGLSTDTNADSTVLTSANITTANTTYYAKYSRPVAITFDGNGSTSGTVANQTATQYVNAYGTTSSNTFTLPSSGYVKDGSTLAGWRIGGTSGTDYNTGDTYEFAPGATVNGTKIFFAKWE